MKLRELIIQLSIITNNVVYGYLKCGNLEYTGWSSNIGPEYTSRKPDDDVLICNYKIKVGLYNSDAALELSWKNFDIPSNMPECYENYVEVYTG